MSNSHPPTIHVFVGQPPETSSELLFYLIFIEYRTFFCLPSHSFSLFFSNHRFGIHAAESDLLGGPQLLSQILLQLTWAWIWGDEITHLSPPHIAESIHYSTLFEPDFWGDVKHRRSDVDV